jgi:hypothetical protein
VSGLDGSDEPDWTWGCGSLFFEFTDISDEIFDFLIGEIFGIGFHDRFAAFDDALLGDFKHFVVFEFFLDFGIGVIEEFKFAAHGGFAAAIFVVAFGAVFGPILFGVGFLGGGGRDGDEGDEESEEGGGGDERA